MNKQKISDNSKKLCLAIIITIAVVIVLVIIIGACAIYLGDYYRADMDAIEAFSLTNEMEYKKLDDDTIIFEPDGAKKGYIFYPG